MKEFEKAIALADQILASSATSDHEYAMCVKGMILRQKGDILQSLKLFQTALEASPRNVELLKQARSLCFRYRILYLYRRVIHAFTL